MSQRTVLKARGLVTDPNQLSSAPEGAMVKAENVVIDRDNVVEPRRGFEIYGNAFGSPSDVAKQLLVYKDRILLHYNSTLLFNNNPHNLLVDGDLQAFDGSYSELETGLRIKAIESNKNLYFTTNDGIKKIAARTASDFTTSAGFIVDAGAVKALDVTGTIISTLDGFLPPNSKVAYRVVWSYKDINDNLIAGSPSSRLVIVNDTNNNANVELEFVIPQNITSSYFYQVYRSAVFTTSGSLTLDDIDPGDELQLVIEDYPTTLTGTVTVTDLAPEDFRTGGLFLYTNPNSGDGIQQANEPPPIAKDITMYQSTVFYANTETRARTTISLLGVEGMTSGVSAVSIDDGVNPPETYTFVGAKEKTEIDFSGYSVAFPAALAVLDGTYFLLNSASNKRKYYVWFDNTKTQQIIDFTTYIYSIAADIKTNLKEKFFILHTKDADRKYYVWYDSTGTDIDPGTTDDTLTGYAGIRVDINSITNINDVAVATEAAISLSDIDDDFDTSISLDTITVESESFDDTQYEIVQNIGNGFSFTFNTPTNQDPANDLITNTDVVGRSGFRINIARGITSKATLTEKIANTIVDEDTAEDFTVDYTTTNEYLEITNNNNGDTTDAVDSAINPIANGFAITIIDQGDGEDASLNQVLLSAAASPAQQIDETARSLVNVINKNTASPVYAFYISGPNDLPGQILLEVKDIGTNTFTVTANDSFTGGLFNPPLPPHTGAAVVEGKAEIKPNRIYYAKLQQPEAVPLLNFIDVGPEDKAIQRILALRESLFLLKEDGVYRLTGLDGNFSVDLFDGSTKIIAPDSAVVLNNQIYCLTNLGMVTISDTGVSIISNDIASDLQLLSSSNYNFKYTTFGVSYENDGAYFLFMPNSVNDDVATFAYRYATANNSLTTFDISKTCGIVNPGDDKLYLGASDTNRLERERKLFNRTDFADRDFELIIPSNSVNDTTLRLSSSTSIDIGDSVVQTQYLTIGEFNQLLKKLDLDPSIGSGEETRFDFTTYVGSIPSALHGKYFILYSASDSTRYAVFYDAVGTLTELDTTVYIDIADAEQIRVNISSGVTTAAQLAEATKTAIQSATFDFLVTYTSGNTYFDTKTTRNGNTTNASDSGVNGVGNGFAITILTQGVGDYYSTLAMEQGNNIYSKLAALATKLDNDPGVAQTNYLAAIGTYSAIGSTVTSGSSTIITQAAHGIETGRLVDITNSTLVVPSINGTYVATRIDANNFSIPVTTTVGGTCDWSANLSTFAQAQGGFNAIINKLNNDTGVTYQNYAESTGTKEFEVLIINKASNTTDVTMQFSMPFIEGPIQVYKGITCVVHYSPETFGDTSILKQVSESTVIFEDTNFSRATVGFRSDLSPGFENIDFTKSGKGDFGFFTFSQHNWGGGFSGVPLRTYVPRQKQKCRYMQLQFIHDSARESFALYGFSYTFRPISERAYRG